ncbi:MAG: SPASM domain-containing protein [Puniceicoccales bacterium]|jgi:uncharacterized protein|nr:SPASM domain-containing protein [Puniceicoccales bacterium]
MKPKKNAKISHQDTEKIECGNCGKMVDSVGKDQTEVFGFPHSPVTAKNTRRKVRATLDKELFCLPLGKGKFLVYAPLRRAAFVANAAAVNSMAALKEGRCVSGKAATEFVEFLRRLEIADAPEAKPPLSVFTEKTTPLSVTLFLTTACNLRCAYCYACAGEGKAQFMSPTLAKRAIDFVVANARERGEKHFEINFHGGGEPTQNWRTLTEAVSYAQKLAKEHGLEFTAYTATNGVFSDKQLDWIIANLSGASVSLDGLPEVHDANRVTTAGQGSSAAVLHTLRRFEEEKFSYGIRMTVTAEMIKRLPDSVDFICANFHPSQLQAEPAFQIGRWVDAPPAETAAFVAAFRKAAARGRKYGAELTFSGARTGTLSNHFCAATQDLFAVTPDGDVSSCYEIFDDKNPRSNIFIYGKENKGGGWLFDSKKTAFLRAQSVDNRPYCKGCFARWSCGGDCLQKILSIYGEKEFAGSGRCAIIRELTKDQILEKIAAAGGVFWHELPGDLHFQRTDAAAVGNCDCVSCGENAAEPIISFETISQSTTGEHT